MPRYSNPRRKATGSSVTLPKVLKGVAIFMAVAGAGAAVVMVMMARPDTAYEEWDVGLIWLAVQVVVVSLVGGLLWYVMARVVERLDQMAEALERIASE